MFSADALFVNWTLKVLEPVERRPGHLQPCCRSRVEYLEDLEKSPAVILFI